jgi:hypothetical protein
VGEIPTLKIQANLQRNKMLYELFFDYEILHLQLKIAARFFLYPIQCLACRPDDDSNIESRRTKPSAWLCEVHVNDEIDDDQSADAKSLITKAFKWILNSLKEDDIQSLIITERNYKKQHPEMEKEKDKNDDDA